MVPDFSVHLVRTIAVMGSILVMRTLPLHLQRRGSLSLFGVCVPLTRCDGIGRNMRESTREGGCIRVIIFKRARCLKVFVTFEFGGCWGNVGNAQELGFHIFTVVLGKKAD